MSARCARTAARASPGGAASSACSSRAIARLPSPASQSRSAQSRTRRRTSSTSSVGVSRTASSASSAAAAAAPRACALSAASSTSGGDLAARLGRGEREMPRSFLRARSDLGEPRVERPPLRRCGARPDRRAEQGVREAEPLPVDLEDSGPRSPRTVRSLPGGRRPPRRGAPSDRRARQRPAPPRAREPRDDRRARERALPDSRESAARRPDLPCRPVAESRSRARGRRTDFPPDVSQMRRSVGRGRTTPARVRSSSLSAPTLRGPSSMVRSRASGTPLRSQTAPRRGRSGLRRPALSRGGQERTGASPATVRRATGCRRLRAGAGCSSGELPQGAQEGECDNALLGGWAFGFRERECGFERTPLRPRQLRQHVGNDASDQVGQPDERERRFRLGRPAGEHQIAAGLRRLDGGEPQRRLADPGLAGTTATAGSPSRASRRSRSEASSSSLPTSSRNPTAKPPPAGDCTTFEYRTCLLLAGGAELKPRRSGWMALVTGTTPGCSRPGSRTARARFPAARRAASGRCPARTAAPRSARPSRRSARAS